jgi:uncharacterized membrane protein YdbT with pleckstrin-like domain
VAFPKKLLNDNESMVLDLRPHWWFMAEPTAALIGALVLGFVVIARAEDDSTAWDIAQWGSGILLLVCLVWFFLRYLKWVTTNFVVTSDRVIYRHGVIAKHGIEIPLERVNTVFFNQSIFERMLGAGDLSIESGGETGKQTFSDIRKPSAVQNELYRQMEGNTTRMYGSGRPAGPADTSIPDQLEKLDELRRRGVISEDEFAAKKAQLLDRM